MLPVVLLSFPVPSVILKTILSEPERVAPFQLIAVSLLTLLVMSVQLEPLLTEP